MDLSGLAIPALLTLAAGIIGSGALSRLLEKQARRELWRSVRSGWRQIWPIVYILLPWIVAGVLLWRVRPVLPLLMLAAIGAGYIAHKARIGRMHLIHLLGIGALAVVGWFQAGPLGAIVPLATPIVRSGLAWLRKAR